MLLARCLPELRPCCSFRRFSATTPAKPERGPPTCPEARNKLSKILDAEHKAEQGQLKTMLTTPVHFVPRIYAPTRMTSSS